MNTKSIKKPLSKTHRKPLISSVKLDKIGADGGEYVVVHRSKLKDFEGNPRQIAPAALRKLVESIRLSGGIIQPPVFNKRTGRIVGGHQRLKAKDMIEGTQDYSLTVCMIDVPESEELSLNIRLNSPLLTGEYDVEALDLLLERPDIDLTHTGLDLNFLEAIHQDAGIDLPEMFLAPEDREAEQALQDEDMEEKLGEALDDVDEAEEVESEEAETQEWKRRKAAFTAQQNFNQQHGNTFRVVCPSDATCSAILDLLGKAYTGEYVDGMVLAELLGIKEKLTKILKQERPKKLKDFKVSDIPPRKKGKR